MRTQQSIAPESVKNEKKKKKEKRTRGVTDAGLGRNGKWSAGRLARTLHTQRPDGIE